MTLKSLIIFVHLIFLATSVNGSAAENLPPLDSSLQASILELRETNLRFESRPNAENLLAIHLACRDLKSQLVRYRSYFGTAATHQLKQAVLPVIDSALNLVQKGASAGVSTDKAAKALEMAQSCRKVLTAERLN